jgi:hypothetical protein
VFNEIVAVDPVRRQIRPLAHQPDLLSSYVENVPTRGGLWVSGFAPATRRPAVATSHDGGQRWTVAVLPGTESADIAHIRTSSFPSVVSRDGRTAYATVWQRDQANGVALTGGSLRVFRTADGGTSWQSVDPSGQLAAMFASVSWVTADGKHVVVSFIGYDSDARSSAHYLVSNDGRSYVEATPPGLPDDATADGRMAHTGTAVYTSSDGWTWHQVWPK